MKNKVPTFILLKKKHFKITKFRCNKLPFPKFNVFKFMAMVANFSLKLSPDFTLCFTYLQSKIYEPCHKIWEYPKQQQFCGFGL